MHTQAKFQTRASYMLFFNNTHPKQLAQPGSEILVCVENRDRKGGGDFSSDMGNMHLTGFQFIYISFWKCHLK